ncbi:MAG: hypothetical protein M3Q71_18640 [Chloroflexota bacterium]|nr:hypothetical protein [Chloroflexota bacterium]
MKIVHKRHHAGVPTEIWVSYLTDAQIRKRIRQILRSTSNPDYAKTQGLDLLIEELERRGSAKDWVARCKQLIADIGTWRATQEAEAVNSASLPPHDRAAS